jgi:hypothetical protein
LLTEEALVAAVYLPYRGEIRDYAGDHQADKPALERLQAEWNRDGMMGFAALYPSSQVIARVSGQDKNAPMRQVRRTALHQC